MHANRTVVRTARRPPRAVELLELLALGPLTAPEAAAALGVHPRTARRHLQLLASSGWASSRTGLVRTYDAAVRPLAAIWQHLARHPLIRAAMPVMAELEREGRLVELAVPSFDEVLAPRPTDAGGWHARGLPPHASAAGKLLLAHRGAWRDRLLALPLTRHTKATIIDPRRLAAELVATRARGFAVERGSTDRAGRRSRRRSRPSPGRSPPSASGAPPQRTPTSTSSVRSWREPQVRPEADPVARARIGGLRRLLGALAADGAALLAHGDVIASRGPS